MGRTSNWLVEAIKQNTSSNNLYKCENLKATLHKACANIFFGYFCSEYFEDANDTEFENMVRMFDDIFWEINQSHPTDVLPWLAPFYRSHLNQIANMGTNIREFVVNRVINPH